jgi:hypothetical protein
MRATREPPADADYRLLTCAVSGQIEPTPAECLVEDDWRPGQAVGRQVRASGLDGIIYQSVRYPIGQAATVFWPNCLTLPIVQSQQFRYRWDGNRMTHYLLHSSTGWTPWPIPGIAEPIRFGSAVSFGNSAASKNQPCASWICCIRPAT